MRRGAEGAVIRGRRRGPSVPALLRDTAFRRFFQGQAISLVGDQVSVIALPLTAVLVLHAGPTQMGYLTAAALLPNLLFSLHAGAWVDRRGRRRELMLACDVGRALLVAAVPIAYWLGLLTLGQLYVVAFLVGTLGVVFSVAYTALFVALVPHDRYVEANALLHGSRAFSYVAGPSLGGALVQVLRAPVALVVDAVSFVVSALFLSRIAPEEPPTEPPGKGHVMSGARWLARSRIMRAELLAVTTINFFNFMFFALFVLYATRTLHVRPGTLGLVLGLGAIGGVLGSFAASRVARRLGIGPAFAAGCVLFPAPLLLVPLAGGPRLLVLVMLGAAEFGSGFGVMLLDIAGGSMSAALVPHRMRSRVAGAFQVVNYGVRPVGSLLGGMLGSAIGLRPTLWIATAGALAGVLFLLPSPMLSLRELPEPVE